MNIADFVSTMASQSGHDVPFKASSEDGQFLKFLFEKGFVSEQDLKRYANVTDRVRKDYPNKFMKYNRNSLKNGVKSIMNDPDIVSAVRAGGAIAQVPMKEISGK